MKMVAKIIRCQKPIAAVDTASVCCGYTSQHCFDTFTSMPRISSLLPRQMGEWILISHHDPSSRIIPPDLAQLHPRARAHSTSFTRTRSKQRCKPQQTYKHHTKDRTGWRLHLLYTIASRTTRAIDCCCTACIADCGLGGGDCASCTVQWTC